MEPNAAQPAANAPVPVIPAATLRTLAVGVTWANVAVAVVATAVVALAKQADWWTPLAASVVVAAIGAIASIAVLSMAAGRTVDWLITFVMGVAGVRMFVSLIGLVVAVMGLHAQPELTALLICCFYAVTLIVETGLLARSAGAAQTAGSAVGGTHA